MSIIPLPRIVSRSEIECPGDIIPYNCSIQSNSEALHLIWHITFPGLTPINIIYNDTSIHSNTSVLDGFVTASITRFIRDEYIESTLEITLQPNASQEHLLLQCFIEELGNDSTEILINSSRKCSLTLDAFI